MREAAGKNREWDKTREHLEKQKGAFIKFRKGHAGPSELIIILNKS